MALYVATLDDPVVRHLTQDDQGWRKNRALNRAIAAARSEYLIFIDGDCVPYPTFVEGHLSLSQKNSVLCGRRSEPGPKFSMRLRNGTLPLTSFISAYLRNFFALKRDHVKHYEEGIYFSPDGVFYRLMRRLRRKE